jgi:NAD(P)-dependent dehydrogenase (short-subunit alcohol dehydrogenase family)
MSRAGRFVGRGVLVTGAAGMAASAARAIVAEGGSVFCVARTEESLAELGASIRAAGGSCVTHLADLRLEDEVIATFEEAIDAFGVIEAVYSVAGMSGRRFGDGPAHEATLVGWDATIRANATVQFLVLRSAVRMMLRQDRDDASIRGSILLMSSTLATSPAPDHFGTIGYAAAKAAIEALVRSSAARYAEDGIRINGIAPSLVATPMSRRAQEDPAILEYLARRQPLAQGPIDADAVTPTALHLLSSDSAMVTGQIVAVDAGWSVSDAYEGTSGQ